VLRLVDGEGQLWGQGEQCPFNASTPCAVGAGRQLQDEHELSIWPATPPGVYQLEMMLISRHRRKAAWASEAGHLATAAAPAGATGCCSASGRRAARPARLRSRSGHRRAAPGPLRNLKLLGENIAPAELRPGDPLNVTLYWLAQGAPCPTRSSGSIWWMPPASYGRKRSSVPPAMPIRPIDGRPATFSGASSRLWLPESGPAGRYTVQMVAEPPLLRSGVTVALRRWLACRLGDCTVVERTGVRLDQVDVLVSASGQAGSTVIPPPPTGLSLSHPLLATLGNQVRFLGYDLSPETVQAGDSFSVTLYWQALRPMEIGYHVFTHLATHQAG